MHEDKNNQRNQQNRLTPEAGTDQPATGFEHKDWLSQEMGKSYLHPEAADLLALIGQPEFIEAHFRSVEEFERSMQKDGYEHIDSSLVTIGWGRRVGDEFANDPTQALVQFRDQPDAVYTIGLGGKGSYFVSKTFEAGNSKEDVARNLEFATLHINSAVSEHVKQFVKEEWDINVS